MQDNHTTTTSNHNLDIIYTIWINPLPVGLLVHPQRNITKIHLLSLTVCLHITTRDCWRSEWHLIWSGSTKICWSIPILVKIWQWQWTLYMKNYMSFRKHLDNNSLNIYQNKRMLHIKLLENNETHVYTQNNLPLSITVLIQTKRGNGHATTVTLCTFSSLLF